MRGQGKNRALAIREKTEISKIKIKMQLKDLTTKRGEGERDKSQQCT